MSRRVVVVGAGLAGMAAAVSLAEGGAQVTVLESAPYLGGRLSTPAEHTVSYGDTTLTFPVEHGIHGIWRQYRSLRRLLADQGLDHLLGPTGGQQMVLLREDLPPTYMEVGHCVRTSRAPVPWAFLSMYKQPSLQRELLRGGMRSGLAAVRGAGHLFAFDPATDLDKYDQHTVAELIEGWPLYLRGLFAALAHSAFFTDIEEAGLDTFLVGLHLYVVRDKRDIGFEVLTLDSQRALLGPLAERIVACGGTVRTGARVTQLEPGAVHRVHIGEEVLEADAVVLAVDPAGYRKLVTGQAETTLGAVQTPDAVPSVSVRLWFSKDVEASRTSCGMIWGPHIDNYFWLHRLQTPYRAWHDATGGAVLEAHQYGSKADRAVDTDDATLIAEVTATAQRAFPELAGSQVSGHVRRNPATHVSFKPGTYATLPPARTQLSSVARCGDWIACRYPTFYLERTVVTGWDAARLVAPALGLDPSRLPAPEPPLPASKGFRATQKLARAMRRLGTLPSL